MTHRCGSRLGRRVTINFGFPLLDFSIILGAVGAEYALMAAGAHAKAKGVDR
jgi:hypothetical protein